MNSNPTLYFFNPLKFKFLESPLPELEHENWAGYMGSLPVRSNNQAGEHIQNDIYGELILTLTPIFLDERFYHFRNKTIEKLLLHLVRLCQKNIAKADAGLWELRNGWQVHSLSNLMCWAGIHRAKKIQEKNFLKFTDINLEEMEHIAIKEFLLSVKEGSARNGINDDSYDASLLLFPILNYPDKQLSEKTVSSIVEKLSLKDDTGKTSGFLYRYLRSDGFGTPPAYSHVGQINAAFSISDSWDKVL
ncbi:MAG: hypothetical protein HQK53_07500 [Oligoflexia bacterium]|nr:hypothetical protein [Oligoflexia bacterium]